MEQVFAIELAIESIANIHKAYIIYIISNSGTSKFYTQNVKKSGIRYVSSEKRGESRVKPFEPLKKQKKYLAHRVFGRAHYIKISAPFFVSKR
jgi:hypothetical protein